MDNMRKPNEAERRQLDLLVSVERADILSALRRLDSRSLTAVARGRGGYSLDLGTPEYWIELADEVIVSDAARELASRHLELRDQGRALATNGLAALGYRYRNTGGWHITAYAIPTASAWRLGFVNIAHGVAVATDASLEPDLVEALTLPGQASGPQISGAAVYSEPDAGEGHRAAAPDGWLQLLVDLRSGAIEPAPTKLRAEMVSWGLATCYGGKLDRPGYATLEGNHREVKVNEWPQTPTTDRVRAVAAAGLGRYISVLAEQAGFGAEGEHTLGPADEVRSFSGIVNKIRWRAGQERVGGLRHAVNFTISQERVALLQELSKHHITHLGQLAGDDRNPWVVHDRWIDVAIPLLEAAVARRLVPVAEALAADLPPFVEEDGKWTKDGDRVLRRLLKPLVHPMIEEVLSDHRIVGNPVDSHDHGAYAVMRAAEAAYFADGPVTVSIDHPTVGDLAEPAPDAPVGIVEIAALAKVARDTVDEWRRRHTEFPEPEWTVGGRPAWRWNTVRQWLGDTGRLRN